MGCDIHMWAEVHDGEGWRVIDPADVGAHDSSYTDEDDPVEYSGGWRTGRDYPLFAALANIRNAGAISPIAHPRGLPDDVTDRVRASVDGWGSDGHSHTWLSLGEIKAYDWSRVAALVDAEWAEITRQGDEMRAELGTPAWAKWTPPAWTTGWLGDMVDALTPLAAPVRLVFWFDN